MLINRNFRRRRLLAIASVTIAAGLVMSACSSSGTTTGSNSDKISLRLIAAEGSGSSNYPDAQVGARAAATAINKAGGVNGKKIDFSFCNTRADANQTVTCDREAVADKVAALVGSVDIYGALSMPVLEAGGVPDIGNLVANPDDSTSPISFPFNGGNFANVASGPQLCKAGGFKKFGVVVNDFASSIAQAKLAMTAAKRVGLETGDIISVPGAGVVDYSPFVQKVKDEGIDCAYVVMGPSGITGVYKAAAATGVKAQFVATVFSFGESEAQAAGTDLTNGIWAASPLPSPSDKTNAAIKAYSADLDATGVKPTDVVLRRSAGLNAWLAVYAAAAIAKSIPGKVTSASMLKALKSTKPIDVKGVFTWDPASLGSSDLGAFPRLPDAPVFALQFENGKLLPTKITPIEAPLKPVR